MNAAVIIAARRTAVAPRNGAFASIEAADLAAACMRALLTDTGLDGARIDDVIFGNALYGGGNPARVAALAAGLPDTIPAMTVDTQCCAGLDAVMLAAARIAAGEAQAVIAGGVESFSRAPIRSRAPKQPGEAPRAYSRPPFTPWPDRDPDMIPAAATLAARQGITRVAQEAFAVESHRKALSATPANGEIVEIAGLRRDAFARGLTARLCTRLPVLAGDPVHGVTAATTAPEADAAAAVLVVSEAFARSIAAAGHPIRIVGGVRRGGDPALPGLAPIAAVRTLLDRHGTHGGTVDVAEVMEAFAAQAMVCIDGLHLSHDCVNRSGGALARGHPIGASGAILAVRLWHELQTERRDAKGLATIAAAGGLATAVLLSR